MVDKFGGGNTHYIHSPYWLIHIILILLSICTCLSFIPQTPSSLKWKMSIFKLIFYSEFSTIETLSILNNYTYYYYENCALCTQKIRNWKFSTSVQVHNNDKRNMFSCVQLVSSPDRLVVVIESHMNFILCQYCSGMNELINFFIKYSHSDSKYSKHFMTYPLLSREVCVCNVWIRQWGYSLYM